MDEYHISLHKVYPGQNFLPLRPFGLSCLTSLVLPRGHILRTHLPLILLFSLMEPPTATISETAELEYDEDDGDEESEYGSEIDEADLSDEERKHCLSKRQKRNQNKLFKPQEYRWQKQTPPSVIRKNPAAKRDRSQVAEESPHYDKTKFPDRVMLACDQKPYFDKKKQKKIYFTLWTAKWK